MAALGATGVAAKSGLVTLLKGGGKKAVIKDLTSVPIGNPPGMPVWFKPLVNKVIKEGTEVGSGAERVIVHKSKLPNSKTDLYVEQQLDTGNVRVEIGIDKHGFPDGHLGQPVALEYRAGEWIEPTVVKKGQIKEPGMKTSDEFIVEEAEFTGGHPENIKFEESTIEKFGEHGSNFDEVEKFATGKIKKKTAKESLKAERSHWVPEGDDMASGGRVPLAEGTTPSTEQLQQYYEDLEKQKERERLQREFYEQRFGGPGPILEAASGGRVPLVGGKLAKTLIQQIIKKYKGRIDDKLLQQMLTDNDPQRLAEVMATIDQGLIMQGKGMGPETIIQTIKDSWKRKKQASGGRVSLSAGGLAGMLGE